MHMIDAEQDAFLILASDGVWEFIESAEAVEIVGCIFSKGWSAEAACKHLIARAAVEWMQEEGDYRDDITCVVVYLSCVTEMASARWRDYGVDDSDADDSRHGSFARSIGRAGRATSGSRSRQATRSELIAEGTHTDENDDTTVQC